jgi:hypothetical protein
MHISDRLINGELPDDYATRVNPTASARSFLGVYK